MPFLETINTSMLVANMDCAHEPTMDGLYNKSEIIERNGRKIGLIGVILETTYVRKFYFLKQNHGEWNSFQESDEKWQRYRYMRKSRLFQGVATIKMTIILVFKS